MSNKKPWKFGYDFGWFIGLMVWYEPNSVGITIPFVNIYIHKTRFYNSNDQ